MSQHLATAPENPLRDAYRRARALPLGRQMSEAADFLSHPEVLVADVAEAFASVARWMDGRELPDLEPVDLEAVDLEELEREPFYTTRQIAVDEATSSFTCHASDVDLLADMCPLPGEREGLDFVGVTDDTSRTPVLGTVQSKRDNSAYLLLLRGLASLAEASPLRQLDRLDQAFFAGRLPEPPCFDLDLVVWDLPRPGDEVTVLEQLTRDLAEAVLRTLAEQTDFAGLLRNVVCLRMPTARFDGTLEFFWRV